MNALNIQKIAILSIESFRFGIETSQIQEIQTFAANRIIGEFEDGSLLVRQHAPQAVLPIFDLRRWFGLPTAPHNVSSHQLTCLIFPWQEQFAGCLIEKFEQVISVQISSLHPVPCILTPIAKKCHVWGFYASADLLLPLFDVTKLIFTPAILDTLHRYANPTVNSGQYGN